MLRAAFPAGTLSGAPKLRAMQIIRELEGRPRGIYGGAVGYLGRDLDFAIAIRTAVCEDGRFEVTAGAGVVEASSPPRKRKRRGTKRGACCARSKLCTLADYGELTSSPVDEKQWTPPTSVALIDWQSLSGVHTP